MEIVTIPEVFCEICNNVVRKQISTSLHDFTRKGSCVRRRLALWSSRGIRGLYGENCSFSAINPSQGGQGIGQQKPKTNVYLPGERGRETSAFEMVPAPFPKTTLK